MSVYVALFRGINVGGKNKISMKSLIKIIEENGYTGIRTYIQSGNVLFQGSHSKAKKFSKIIGQAIQDHYGFHPDILIIDSKQLEQSVNANPFPQAENHPKSLHLYFLDCLPKHFNIEKLNKLKSANESFQIIDRVFYLHAPDGIGRSKLAAKIEVLLGIKATARNWNTVFKLLKICSEIPPQ
ncbi:MAG: DUF1697 domain-containing protein [Chlamydiales bacterium]|nr:DUF1697 domain-containing protein [Chlamydiales bacterium]